MKYFNFKQDRLCNLIVKEMGYMKTLKLHQELEREKKLVINFNLNERNTKYFKDMVKLSHEESEAEFLRGLLSTYANLHPFLRERILHRDKFRELEEAIKGKYQIRAEVEGKIKDIEPLELLRDEVQKYGVLKYQIEKNICHQKIKDIEILKT